MDRNMAKKFNSFDEVCKSLVSLYVMILLATCLILPVLGASVGMAVHLFLRLSGLG